MIQRYDKLGSLANPWRYSCFNLHKLSHEDTEKEHIRQNKAILTA